MYVFPGWYEWVGAEGFGRGTGVVVAVEGNGFQLPSCLERVEESVCAACFPVVVMKGLAHPSHTPS